MRRKARLPDPVTCEGDGALANADRSEALGRDRAGLKRFITHLVDRRIAARVDASDVVQETLAQVSQDWERIGRLTTPDRHRLLRRIARRRAIDAYRRHVGSARRSVTRERRFERSVGEGSGANLAEMAAADSSTPDRKAIFREDLAALQRALGRLSRADREVLELRHLAQLSVVEIAGVLGMTATAVTSRHFRAMRRLRVLLPSALAR